MPENEVLKDDVLEELPELPGEPEEGQEDTTDWKAEAAKFHGMASRSYKALKKLKANPPKPAEQPVAEPKKNEPEGFGYGEKAFLKASGVESEDFEFIAEEMRNTGKSLEEVLGFKYVQEELKARKDQRVTLEATPRGGKRSATSSRDQVDYWLAKGGLPDDPILARKVVQARTKQATEGSKFSDTPVV